MKKLYKFKGCGWIETIPLKIKINYIKYAAKLFEVCVSVRPAVWLVSPNIKYKNIEKI